MSTGIGVGVLFCVFLESESESFELAGVGVEVFLDPGVGVRVGVF